jgi:hypothetical protein
MRPGQSVILLRVILFCRFADDYIFAFKNLMRVLIAESYIVALTRVPIETTGIVLERSIETLSGGVGSR